MVFSPPGGEKESQSCKVEGFKTTRSTESSQDMQNIQKTCIFSRVSEATLGSFPVYKGFKNMGKSTQKVGKGDLVSNSFLFPLAPKPRKESPSCKVEGLKATRSAKDSQKWIFCLVFRSNARDLFRVSKATLGT